MEDRTLAATDAPESKFSFPGRMGERIREADEQVRTRDAGETETGRTERADTEAPAGAGGFGEEHDPAEG